MNISAQITDHQNLKCSKSINGTLVCRFFAEATHFFPMDEIVGDQLIGLRTNGTLYGKPPLVTGKFGSALKLGGFPQYGRLGDFRQECFGDVRKCDRGFTLSVLLRLDTLYADSVDRSSTLLITLYIIAPTVFNFQHLLSFSTIHPPFPRNPLIPRRMMNHQRSSLALNPVGPTNVVRVGRKFELSEIKQKYV